VNRRKTENNARVRFLSDDEEAAITTAITKRFPKFLPHFLLSVHTGMRAEEMYSLRWIKLTSSGASFTCPRRRMVTPESSDSTRSPSLP